MSCYEIVGVTYAEMKGLSSYVASLGGRNYLSKSMLLSIYEAARNKGCQTTAYVYDERLNISSVINPNGYETSYSYDSEGRLESVRDHIGVCMDIHIISNKDENNKNCKYVASSLCLDHFFQGTKSYSKLCDE